LANSALQRLMKSGSFWAIADQGIASAGNFVTSLLLARSLAPAEFGTFVLLNSACLVVLGFQGNLIVSPLVVLGASGSVGRTRSYLTVALVFTLALLPVTALVVLPAAVSLHRVITGIFALIYVLSWQLQETPRRALLSAFRYRDAIWGDAISFLGQALLVSLLVIRKHVTLDEAFVLMAATSLIAAALQSWQVRLTRTSWAEIRDCGVQFWALGKWLAIVSLMTAGQGPLFPWLLSWFHGREAAARFQAVINVWGLTSPVINSIPAMVMPATAAFLVAKDNRTRKTLLAFGMRYVVQLELILAPLFLAVALWPQLALTLFYGRSSVYVTQTLALRIGVIVFMITVPMTVFGAVLTGAGKTKGNVTMNGAGTLASLLSAPPLIFAGGIVGAMGAEIITRAVRVLWAIRLLGPNSAAGRVDEAAVEDQSAWTQEK